MVRIKTRYLLVQILYPTFLPAAPLQPNPNQSPTKPSTLLTPPSPASPILPLHTPTPDIINPPHLLCLLRHTLALLFGDAGAALAGATLGVRYWSNATSTLILRCRRECVRWVWAAVCFVRGVCVPGEGVGERIVRFAGVVGEGGDAKRRERESEMRLSEVECVMRVLRCSGSVRKCEEEAVRRARGMVGRVRGLDVAGRGGIDVSGVVGGRSGGGVEGGDDAMGNDGEEEGEDVVMAGVDDSEGESEEG